MFSRRMDWAERPNRLAEAQAELARAGRANTLIDLTESNPTRLGLAPPEELVAALLSDRRAATYSPDPQGLPSAREAICRSLSERCPTLAPEQVLVTASTSESYSWLFKVLADPGERILVPTPSYPLFEHLSRLESVIPIPYPLRYDGEWHLEFGALEEAAREGARAVVVVSPNNPTGSYLKRSELARLDALCRDHSMALIGDEVFFDYSLSIPSPHEPRCSVLESTAPLAISLGGLSKSCAAPQLKLGWMALVGEEGPVERARAALTLVADTFLSANTPAQLALPELLAQRAAIQRPIIERIGSNLASLRALWSERSNWNLLPVEGGWSAILRVPRSMTEEEWVLTLLREEELLLHPGYFFDFPSEAYLILSLLTERKFFRKGTERLVERLGRYV